MALPWSTAQLSFAGQHPFQGGKAFKADRTTCMQTICRDTDFCAQTVLKTIGETGGQVDVDRAGVHFALETGGSRKVFGDDGLGMLRTVLLDVLHGLVDVVHYADGEDRSQIFCFPIFLCGWQRGGKDGTSAFAATQLYALGN